MVLDAKKTVDGLSEERHAGEKLARRVSPRGKKLARKFLSPKSERDFKGRKRPSPKG